MTFNVTSLIWCCVRSTNKRKRCIGNIRAPLNRIFAQEEAEKKDKADYSFERGERPQTKHWSFDIPYKLYALLTSHWWFGLVCKEWTRHNSELKSATIAELSRSDVIDTTTTTRWLQTSKQTKRLVAL